jgi:hypothetical protein
MAWLHAVQPLGQDADRPMESHAGSVQDTFADLLRARISAFADAANERPLHPSKPVFLHGEYDK